MRARWRHGIVAGLARLVLAAGNTAGAQNEPAPCGYADHFDLPVPDIDQESTDFGIYRARFGGLHTGIDVAFNQLGAPVQAAARGRVTYSDPAGWGTEKGVVVIQHTMPDGSLVNTLYGHMEELEGHFFPALEQCVERGDIVGAIGAPSLGLPHLHFEVRTRYRHEGGPGYTATNPLELGWYHPLDFTALANLWVLPAHRGHYSLLAPAILPPLLLPDSRGVVVAHSQYLEGLSLAGQALWRFDTISSASALYAMPDNRVLVALSGGQVLILNDGSYSALWQSPQTAAPPILFAGNLVFATADHRLAAFSLEGSPAWQSEPLAGRPVRWAISGDRLAAAAGDGQLTIFDAAGTVLAQTTYPGPVFPIGAPDGEFNLLSGSMVLRLDQALAVVPLFEIDQPFTGEAGLLRAASGLLYVYPGEGRALYAYWPDGVLAWVAYMPGSHLHAPLLATGGGRLLYVLTTDGQLLVYDAGDGRLVTLLALYNGGVDGIVSSRWLDVQPDDLLRFSSGYLSIVTIQGLDLLDDDGAG